MTRKSISQATIGILVVIMAVISFQFTGVRTYLTAEPAIETQLINLARNIKTPLSLSGLVLVMMYLVYKQILATESRARSLAQRISPVLAKYLFVLALVAMLLGFAGWVIGYINPEQIKLFGRVHRSDDQRVGIADATVSLDLEFTRHVQTDNGGEFEFVIERRYLDRQGVIWATAKNYADSKQITIYMRQQPEKVLIPMNLPLHDTLVINLNGSNTSRKRSRVSQGLETRLRSHVADSKKGVRGSNGTLSVSLSLKKNKIYKINYDIKVEPRDYGSGYFQGTFFLTNSELNTKWDFGQFLRQEGESTHAQFVDEKDFHTGNDTLYHFVFNLVNLQWSNTSHQLRQQSFDVTFDMSAEEQ